MAVQAQASEKFVERRDWQADHVGIGALDALYEPGGSSLDGVPAGLVASFTALDEPRDLLVPERCDEDGRQHHRDRVGTGIPYADSREDVMTPARQPLEHLSRLSVVRRLAQNGPVDHDRGVGPEHHRARSRSGMDELERSGGLLACQPADVVLRRFTNPDALVNLDGSLIEREPGSGEQFGTTG